MSFTPFDSPLYRQLFSDGELGALFSDAAEVRAMLLFEGALAEVQGELGIIPLDSALFIARAAREVPLDPAAMAGGVAAAGVAGPALVEAFRQEIKAPDHAAWVHHGATSQDVVDTGLVLRLRRANDILRARIEGLAEALAALAERHADLPMAARTRHQIAAPTTFGARVATWHAPLPRHLDRLAALTPRLGCVSLAGAAGTSAALGPMAAEVEAGVAAKLGLGVAAHPWNAARDGIAELGAWLVLVCGTLGKIAVDVLSLVQSSPPEIALAATGGSSTMPNKTNPVAAEAVLALARHVMALNGSVQQAQLVENDRDGAAWGQEWLALPQMVCATGAALAHTRAMIDGLEPQPDAMRAVMDATYGTIFAEAVTFALADHMRRPEAAALVKEACRRASATDGLRAILERESPAALDWDRLFDPLAQSGRAPKLARGPRKARP